MKACLLLVVGTFLMSGVAGAQVARPDKGYLEGIAQSAFGNVTSQSYGAEFGVTVMEGIQVFVEVGRIKNVATSTLGADAAQVAGYLTAQSSSLTYSVKEPVTFGLAGVKYRIPTTYKVQPYALGGFGIAKYTHDARFLIGGTDVTSSLSSYGVTLGTDLSGDFTRPALTFGGGVDWPVWEQVVVDFQYRYGRILAKDQGINTNRIGIGLGVRF